MEGDSPFGTPMFQAGEPTEEQKTEMRAEADRLRDLQERSVNSEMARTQSDAVLKLAQAIIMLQKHGPTAATAALQSAINALVRIADSIK